MKLRCIETGRTTKLPSDEFDSIQEAADRIVKRDWSGHYAQFSGVPSREALFAEVCRSVGGMCEHTGKKINFEIIE